MAGTTETLTTLPQHDPSIREEFAQLGPWSLRQFPVGDFRLEYMAEHGMLHVQVLHANRAVSVLSPSDFTQGLWDVYAAGHGRWSFRDLGAVNLCLSYIGLPPLGQDALFEFIRSNRSAICEELRDASSESPERTS